MGRQQTWDLLWRVEPSRSELLRFEGVCHAAFMIRRPDEGYIMHGSSEFGTWRGRISGVDGISADTFRMSRGRISDVDGISVDTFRMIQDMCKLSCNF